MNAPARMADRAPAANVAAADRGLRWALALAAAAGCWLLSRSSVPLLQEWHSVNAWFGSDTGRVAMNMTVIEKGHGSSYKHPIFPLLLLPPTRLLMELGLSATDAIRGILALNAAAFAALLDRAGVVMGLRRADRLLLVLLFLASAAFTHWFSVPETFPFGATGLLLAFLLVARADAPAWQWAASLIAGFAITITNAMATAAAFVAHLGLGRWRGGGWRADLPLISRAARGGALGMAILVAASVAQNLTFGGAALFFNPVALWEERRFVEPPHVSGLAERFQTAVAQPMVAGRATPPADPRLNERGVLTEGLLIDGRWPAAWVGKAAAGLWLAMLAAGVAALFRRAKGQVHALGAMAGLFLLGNLALHSLYGAEVFLYVAHFLPALLLIAAAGPRLLPAWLWRAGAALLVAGALVSNLTERREALSLTATTIERAKDAR